MPAPLAPGPGLGADIRKRRIRKGLTQDQLADIIGVSQAQVSQWESGKARPSPEHFAALRETLGSIPYGLYFAPPLLPIRSTASTTPAPTVALVPYTPTAKDLVVACR